MPKKVTYDIKGKVNGTDVESVTLISSWQCVKNGKKYVIKKGQPTEAKETISITYWMPSGAKIKSAQLLFKRNNPTSGISKFTVNKKQVTKNADKVNASHIKPPMPPIMPHHTIKGLFSV